MSQTQIPDYIDIHAREDTGFFAELTQINLLSGQPYLEAIVPWLRRILNIYALSIGDITGNRAEMVNVRCFDCADPGVTSVEYPLLGAPCLDVITHNEPLCVAQQVTHNYPNDEIFSDLGISSYVGVPLQNENGRPIGVLCAFDTSPILSSREFISVLTWIAPRISAELAHLRMTEFLLWSVEWATHSEPGDLFREMMLLSTRALQVSGGFIAEWDEDNPDEYHIVCAVEAGETIDVKGLPAQPFTGMPCARLRDTHRVFVGHNLRQQHAPSGFLASIFPDPPDSYLAYALSGPQGRKIGHIGWVHSGTMHPALEEESAAQVFRNRASAEINRMRADRERATMADALLVKHKLESLGLMAGAIAHDFNNLLVTIIGNANLALDHTGESGKAYLAALEQAGLRAGDIVKQLLTYAGERQGDLTVLDLNDTVRDTQNLLELSKHPNANLRYNLKPGLPPTQADHAQLQQIIINLVLNALEALEDNAGDIIINTYQTKLTTKQIRRLLRGKDIEPGRYVVLEVSDNGVGMNAEILSRMFDPFFTSKATGRGLGMAALQGFANAYHSGIEVISAPGEGTTIRVFLQPAVHHAKPEHPAHQDSGLLNLNKTTPILVVDDEQDVRLITTKLLESLDYEVQACDSGQAAIDLVSEGANFSLAFIDVSMPGLNGWETLKEIRNYLPDLAIVMISGYTEQDSASRDAGEQQASFLAKPFRRHDLAAAIAHSTQPRH